MTAYLYLTGLWGLFGLTHSLLAATWWKDWVARSMGVFFRYYRLLYSLFALLLLVTIVIYELQIRSYWLWHMPLGLQLLAGIPALAGLVIMGICIRRYFFYLSGIDVLYPRRKTTAQLVTSGLNRYVRHPLYFGTLLALWSFFLVFPELGYLITCLSITVYTWIGTLWEEKKLQQEFGAAYRAYQQSVPMLIPFRM
ncbi:isoprenylcysteine carboxylmethyltransferase family protein [Paraflavitalea soli]|uniref:Isoprenylcysteine carboxylmethyltransferase family protein n=1 Tax=Paraflavitalea soli TaxID=2315862 RepID=A0A3B7MPI3_9BACT|nr:NnrU family protein [Paraflavitalea soli]AXY75229.1 isoprenylcysteine carboxylmethyltransferase family protein [Paraflavitalea soli]